MLSVKELHIRAALLRAIRSFFERHDFLEVETPVRLPVIIPEAYIEPITAGRQYLQTSPELCMKRLLAAGCPRIFQLCRCFRREERGRRHLEEFTMLEWYRSGADYFDLMRDCEQLLHHCLSEIGGLLGPRRDDAVRLFGGGDSLEAMFAWQKMTVKEAFARWSARTLAEVLACHDFDEVLVEEVEPHLGMEAPLLLYDYPSSMASLARKKKGEESVAERFELYVGGVELANGFSELTDAKEQRQRFAADIAMIEERQGRNMDMPERFLADLETLDECAGIAFGVDRLFMLLLGKQDIGDAVPFSPADL